MVKSLFSTASLCAALCLTGSYASAESHSAAGGLYFHGFVGANRAQDVALAGTIGGAPQTVFGDFDTGANIGVAIGRSFGNGWRGEIELSHQRSPVSTLDFTGNAVSPEINTDGDIRRLSLMANALYDFDTGGAFTPYVGLGIGATRTDYSLVYAAGVNISEADTTFGAQLIAGGAFAVNDTTAITADIRYSRAFDPESTRLNGAGALTGTVSDDIDAVSLNLGVRINF